MKSRLLKNCNLPFFCFRIKLQDLLPSGFAIDVNRDKSKMAKTVKGVVKNLSLINFKKSARLNSAEQVLRRKYEAKSEIRTSVSERVFDPFDERWVFIDEPTPDCLGNHENIKIIKNEGGEKE